MLFERLPFQLNSVRRFIAVNVVQSASCWLGTTILITIMSMYFGIIIYIRAFLVDIDFFFDEMDALSHRNDTESMNAKLISLVHFHINITEWVSMWTNWSIQIKNVYFLILMLFVWNRLAQGLGNVVQTIIFVTFTPCIFSICASLLKGQSVRIYFMWCFVLFLATVCVTFSIFGSRPRNNLTSQLFSLLCSRSSTLSKFCFCCVTSEMCSPHACYW